MDDLRKLRYELAELLGRKAQPFCCAQRTFACNVGWGGGRGDKAMDSCCDHLPCPNMTEPPNYPEDPIACMELDGEMRGRGFGLYLEDASFWSEGEKWYAVYISTKETYRQFMQDCCGVEGPTELIARCLAAKAALQKLKEEK